jgi:hypothetical protein
MAQDRKAGVLREEVGKAREKSKAGEWRGPSDKAVEQDKSPPERLPSPGQPAGGE